MKEQNSIIQSISARDSNKDPNVIEYNEKEYSRYIQTSWRLSPKSPLIFPELGIKIRNISSEESKELAKYIKRRNIFARHSYENHFYVERTEQLANKTVIEVFRQGNPDKILDEVKKIADMAEKIIILSSILAVSRIKLQHQLAISLHMRKEFDLTIGPMYQYLKSNSKPEPELIGLIIDDRFIRRFRRCGFSNLIKISMIKNDNSPRVISAINWLYESRHEPMLHAAIVKTSIALESLLIFQETEPLSKSLAERSAFIISSEAGTRKKVSKLVKRFYEVRSGIVHGSRKKIKKLNINLLESMDRITLLLCLIIASNIEKWKNTKSMVNWFEMQRWGTPSLDMVIPFPKSYLINAIDLGFKENIR